MPIPALPAEFLAAPGVQMTPPPPSLLPAVTAHIAEALSALPPGKTGALVFLATEAGVNLAVASRIGGQVSVAAYIGKTWGTPVAAGIVGQVTW